MSHVILSQITFGELVSVFLFIVVADPVIGKFV